MPYLPILDILRPYFEIGEIEREAVIRKRVKEKIPAFDEKLHGIIAPIQDLLSLKVDLDLPFTRNMIPGEPHPILQQSEPPAHELKHLVSLSEELVTWWRIVFTPEIASDAHNCPINFKAI